MEGVHFGVAAVVAMRSLARARSQRCVLKGERYGSPLRAPRQRCSCFLVCYMTLDNSAGRLGRASERHGLAALLLRAVEMPLRTRVKAEGRLFYGCAHGDIDLVRSQLDAGLDVNTWWGDLGDVNRSGIYFDSVYDAVSSDATTRSRDWGEFRPFLDHTPLPMLHTQLFDTLSSLISGTTMPGI